MDKGTYNKKRKEVAQALQRNGYQKVSGSGTGTYFEHESGEKIVIRGDRMLRGFAFVVEAA